LIKAPIHPPTHQPAHAPNYNHYHHHSPTPTSAPIPIGNIHIGSTIEGLHFCPYCPSQTLQSSYFSKVWYPGEIEETSTFLPPQPLHFNLMSPER